MSIWNLTVINRFLLYLFAFSLAFERAYPFLPGLSFPKAVAIIYFLSLFLNANYVEFFFKIKVNKLILLLFGIWLLLNFFNQSYMQFQFIDLDISFLLNIALLWLLLNHQALEPKILINSLIYFSLGYLCLVFLYYLGIYQTQINGRVYMGSALPNALGMSGVIAFSGFLRLINTSYNGSLFIKPFIVIAAIMTTTLILATGSRSAALSLIFVLGVYFVWSSAKSRIALLIIGLSLIPTFLSSFEVIVDRSMSTIENAEFGGRLNYWFFMIDVISNNIALGVGQHYYDLLTENQFGYSPSPHNVFVEVFIMGGICAFFLWLWTLKLLITHALNSFKLEKNITSLVLLPPIFLVAISGQIFNNSLLFFIFALIISSDQLNRIHIDIPHVKPKYVT